MVDSLTGFEKESRKCPSVRNEVIITNAMRLRNSLEYGISEYLLVSFFGSIHYVTTVVGMVSKET
jgi:hypothetical protein